MGVRRRYRHCKVLHREECVICCGIASSLCDRSREHRRYARSIYLSRLELRQSVFGLQNSFVKYITALNRNADVYPTSHPSFRACCGALDFELQLHRAELDERIFDAHHTA